MNCDLVGKSYDLVLRVTFHNADEYRSGPVTKSCLSKIFLFVFKSIDSIQNIIILKRQISFQSAGSGVDSELVIEK